MASSSLLSFVLCFLVLFHCSAAQIQQVTSTSPFDNSGRKEQQRQQQTCCRLESISALEPSRKIRSEAGVTEIWDENDDQFQCAGVVAIRHTIQQRGLLLPAYANAPKLVYVVQGRGYHGAAIPGCPETYQSTESQSSYGGDRQTPRDQHQKIREIREGDVFALPAGVADWVYNKGQNPLVLVLILDTRSSANQLDENFRKFFLAGNPQQELTEGQQGWQGQYQGSESKSGKQDNSGNILSGLDLQLLADSFNIDRNLARKLQNENDNRGIIVHVERDLSLLSPQESREVQGCQSARDNGIEETFCTARLRHFIDDPARADVYNPGAGRVTTVNSWNLPILRNVRLSAQKVVLYKNAIMSPHWNINAHSVCYFTRGRGRVQIVGDHGRTVFDGQVQEGQIVTVPQNFVVLKRAGSEGLEWISFKTNEYAKINQLVGRVSAMRAMPEDVIANAYQISREDARRIKNNREEVTLLSPGSRSLN